jgi:lipoyl(octanoyl) transferase
MNLPPLRVVDLGRAPYGEVLDIQRRLAEQRWNGTQAHDILLLVEHDPVVTLGRGSRPESLPLPAAELRRLGVDLYEVERGGDVTWHGPGQLVGYPILDLTALRQDLHWYLRQLEAGLIRALGALGIPAEPRSGLTGVWTRGRKIASIGIHVRHWVTFHGFALNVTGTLDGFGLIVPCGIPDVVMTSVERESRLPDAHGDAPASAYLSNTQLWSATSAAVCDAIGHGFNREPVMTEPAQLGLAPVVEHSAPSGRLAGELGT